MSQNKPWINHSKYSEPAVFVLVALLIVLTAWLGELSGNLWAVVAAFLLGMIHMRLFRYITSGNGSAPKFDGFVDWVTGLWSLLIDFLRFQWLPWRKPRRPIESRVNCGVAGHHATIKQQREAITVHAQRIAELEESNDFLRSKLVATRDIEPPKFPGREKVVGNIEPVDSSVEVNTLLNPTVSPPFGSAKSAEVTHGDEVGLHDPLLWERASRRRIEGSDRVLVWLKYSWDDAAVADILNNADVEIDPTNKRQVVDVVKSHTALHGLHASRFHKST